MSDLEKAKIEIYTRVYASAISRGGSVAWARQSANAAVVAMIEDFEIEE